MGWAVPVVPESVEAHYRVIRRLRQFKTPPRHGIAGDSQQTAKQTKNRVAVYFFFSYRYMLFRGPIAQLEEPPAHNR